MMMMMMMVFWARRNKNYRNLNNCVAYCLAHVMSLIMWLILLPLISVHAAIIIIITTLDFCSSGLLYACYSSWLLHARSLKWTFEMHFLQAACCSWGCLKPSGNIWNAAFCSTTAL